MNARELIEQMHLPNGSVRIDFEPPPEYESAVEKSFDESSHPRRPAGSAQGGEFAPAGSAGASSASSSASADASIQISGDDFYGNEVKVGNEKFRGKIVDPYSLPVGIPTIPKEDAIYMEAGPFGARHVIDTRARLVYTLTKDKEKDEWKLDWRTNIATPQDVAPASAKLAGSAAWADKMNLSRSKGSAFDKQLIDGHAAVATFDLNRDFNKVESDFITDKESTSINDAMRKVGGLEAAALTEPFRMPTLESLKAEAVQFTGRPEKQAAEFAQLERWQSVLKGASREEALNKINREYQRLKTKQDARWEATHQKFEELVKAGKEEEGHKLFLEYSDKDMLGGRKTALFVIREAVVKDLVDRLEPFGYANSYEKLKITNEPSPLTDAEQEKVMRAVYDGVKWLAHHIHPSAFDRMAVNPPKIQTGYAKDSFDRSNYSGGDEPEIRLRPEDGKGTVIHEYGHHLDAASGFQLPDRDFVMARGLHETVPLNRLTGYDAYKPDEVAHPDRFVNPYVGKDYFGSNVTEVTSMGLQSMATDPVDFYRKDREHFLYMVYLMRGGR